MIFEKNTDTAVD